MPIQHFKAQNFRCLENIELDPGDSMKKMVLLESQDGEDYKDVQDQRMQAVWASAAAKRKNSCVAILKNLIADGLKICPRFLLG